MHVDTVPITAVVLTKNEERSLPDCLSALNSIQQILVIDSHSTDQTTTIAKSSGAKVVSFDWNGAYPKKKQWSLQLPEIRHDWVLFVDADERPDEEFLTWLGGFLARPGDFAAADVPLRYRFLGHELKHGHRVLKRALVNRRMAHFPNLDDLDVSNMWEVEGHYQPLVSGPVAAAKGALIHDDKDPVFDWFARHNRYSDWEAAVRTRPHLRKQVNQARTRQGKVFDRLPFKPLVFFFAAYILKGGWRDGRAGFSYALALATYYAMIEIKVLERRQQATL